MLRKAICSNTIEAVVLTHKTKQKHENGPFVYCFEICYLCFFIRTALSCLSTCIRFFPLAACTREVE